MPAQRTLRRTQTQARKPAAPTDTDQLLIVVYPDATAYKVPTRLHKQFLAHPQPGLLQRLDTDWAAYQVKMPSSLWGQRVLRVQRPAKRVFSRPCGCVGASVCDECDGQCDSDGNYL